MPFYITHFICDPSAWPSEHKSEIDAWNEMISGANKLIEGEGSVKFSGWISNSEGYALLEAESKAEVIKLCAEFWPLFQNDIMEIVPTYVAGPAIIAGVTEAAKKK